MDKDGYKWWIERLRESFKIYDIADRPLRSFESYQEAPAGSDTQQHQVNGSKGPGYKLFAAVKEGLGDLNIIAEDAGFRMTDEVIELRGTGFPGIEDSSIAFNPDDESIGVALT